MNYYVRLVQGKGILSRLIEFKESDWPSHVELIECDEHDEPRRVLGSRYPDGVQIRRPDAFPLTRESWYKHTWSNAAEWAWGELETLIGRKYDVRDILGITFDQDWHKDGRWICSEAVAWAFEQKRFFLFNPNEPVRRIWPRDFLLTPQLRLYRFVKP